MKISGLNSKLNFFWEKSLKIKLPEKITIARRVTIPTGKTMEVGNQLVSILLQCQWHWQWNLLRLRKIDRSKFGWLLLGSSCDSYQRAFEAGTMQGMQFKSYVEWISVKEAKSKMSLSTEIL